MAVGKNGGQRAIDDVSVADHDFADFRTQSFESFTEILNPSISGRRGGIGDGVCGAHAPAASVWASVFVFLLFQIVEIIAHRALIGSGNPIGV